MNEKNLNKGGDEEKPDSQENFFTDAITGKGEERKRIAEGEERKRIAKEEEGFYTKAFEKTRGHEFGIMRSVYQGFNTENLPETRKLIEDTIAAKIPTKRIPDKEIDPGLKLWFTGEISEVISDIENDETANAAIEALTEALEQGKSFNINLHTSGEILLVLEGKFNQVVENFIHKKQEEIDKKTEAEIKLTEARIKKEKETALAVAQEHTSLSTYLKEKNPITYDRNLEKFEKKWEKIQEDETADLRKKSEKEKKQAEVQLTTLAHNVFEESINKDMYERQAIKKKAVEIVRPALNVA